MSRRRRRLFGRWVVALGVAAALIVLTLQFSVTREAYGAALPAIQAAHARTGPALYHLAGVRRAINAVYRDLALTVARLPDDREAVGRLLGRQWPLVDGHLRALEDVPSLPGEVGQRQQLELLLDALRTAEPQLLDAADPAQARALLEWQLLPLVREIVRTIDGLTLENARVLTAAGRQLELSHEHADRLALLLYLAVLTAVAASGGLAFVILSRAEGEMQRRLEELDAFAGRVAHDLRSPLQPALLSAAFLRAHCPDDSLELIDRMERSMRQAAELVDALLVFARSGATPDPAARAVVAEVLRDLEPELRELAASERARLTIDVEPGLEVCTDRSALQSIVGNLARNALLYLGPAATRDVRVVAAGSGPREVSLQVSDTGPGIPADLRRRLFQPFERGSTRPGGSGLGLATVQRLVDAHGGSIAMVTRVGGGTTFTVHLPRPRRRGAAADDWAATLEAGCAPGPDR